MKKSIQFIYITLGTLFVGLGLAGIILPLLPTTPFLLLAAVCYARSSERCYNWLLTHRWFGEYIRNYLAGRGIPLKSKITAILLIWTTIGTTALFVIDLLWVRIILVGLASGVSLYLYSLPTLKKGDNENTVC